MFEISLNYSQEKNYESDVVELFFDDLVAHVLKAAMPQPNGEAGRTWNEAVGVCINRIYSFFGRGHPPAEVTRQCKPPTEIRPLVEDGINHPSWYCWGGIETLDFILAKELDYLLGNAVKYISRAGRKDPEAVVEDLKKARFYIDKKLEVLNHEA